MFYSKENPALRQGWQELGQIRQPSKAWAQITSQGSSPAGIQSAPRMLWKRPPYRPELLRSRRAAGVQRILLDGANFCFMGACGQRRCLLWQGQAGIYVGNLKPKLVGRLREQAGLCLGREVRYNEGVASQLFLRCQLRRDAADRMYEMDG